ncbi:hypothetical protein AB1Y20_003860 [Prymnesium parvum]|uniref:Uncharacterized protein n=1 Tax=Prymnesium parvum TaxID=97485 RepID=A0AB34J5W9_PRYPA
MAVRSEKCREAFGRGPVEKSGSIPSAANRFFDREMAPLLAPAVLAFLHGAAAVSLPHVLTARSTPRVRPIRAQQGPLEEGYRELLPMRNEEGSVDPQIVLRMEEEVQQLMGVSLEDLLNPSKVVNLERERLLLEADLARCTDSAERNDLEQRREKVEKQLYSEKRTVFRGWLKGVFVGQSVLAIVISGFAAFDAFPTVTIDISLQALGFWSYWLFVIPSLRARRPKGWEKKALNWAFLGSPLLTIGLPFVTKEPQLIWSANLALLIGCYVIAYATGDAEEVVGGFSGVLRWLDFGSGQERGMRAEQREKLAARQAKAEPEEEPRVETDATSATKER